MLNKSDSGIAFMGCKIKWLTLVSEYKPVLKYDTYDLNRFIMRPKRIQFEP